MLVFLLNGVLQVLGVGTVSLIAHAVGRKDRVDANLVFNQSLGLAAAVRAADMGCRIGARRLLHAHGGR